MIFSSTASGEEGLHTAVLDGVGELGESTELIEAVSVTRDASLGRALEVDVLDLNIRNGGLEGAAPVDETVGSVDETTVIELDEGLLDGTGEVLRIAGKDNSIPRPW